MMKLDRNTNSDGTGKYALINLRRLTELHDAGQIDDGRVENGIDELTKAGLIHWGTEGPGEQFFVMKYKDRFTGRALHAYALAVKELAEATSDKSIRTDLIEYAEEIKREADTATLFGNRIPD